MRLKLTLVRPSGGSRDIVVSADAVATVGDVARTLLERDPERAGAPVSPDEATLSVQFPGEAAPSLLAADVPITEARIASGAQVSVISAGGSATGRGPVLAILRVVNGPDRGKEFQLHSGTSVIGRDAGADLVLSDPEVSKRHARIEVTRTVDFVDLNSANGLIVDGGEVTRVSLESGQLVTLGGTALRAELVESSTREVQSTRSGPVAFNRSPRVESRYPGEVFDGPDVPKQSEPVPFPWLALAAPLVLGVVLYFVLGRGIASLAFVALSPVLMVGTFFTQRMRVRSKRKAEIAAFDDQLARLAATMNDEVERERFVRHSEAISTADVIAQADALGPVLWTRRPEHWNFLNVRLGVGTAPSRNSITGKNDTNGLAEFASRLDETVDTYENIENVPIVDNLVGAGALGISGDPALAARVTHSVLAQLTGLHSPLELSVTAIVGPAWSQEFEWLKWLPHTGGANAPVQGVQLAANAATGTALLAQLEELIQSRTNERTGTAEQNRGPISLDDSVMVKGAEIGDGTRTDAESLPPTPCVVVLITDDAPVDRARLVTMIERAAEVGILPIWVSEKQEELPAACRTFLEIPAGAQFGTIGFVRTGQRIENVYVDLLTSGEALAFAKRLASVTDAGALVADESDIPRSVSFVELLGPEMTESSDAVIDRWTQNASIHDRTPGAPLKSRKAGRLRALVGQASADALHLDLRTQGPHALVGGTTGAGKSEFLQAWVLGMAAEYSPDRVSFLFVDYKGGAAFADCVNLPHTVGLVTDLSPHLVRRALTSLRAELRHREHLLNRKKAKDLIELEKRGDPDSPPALVLVIDEFAALVSEIPEFVDGVVDIAQRGRSLGIHLIMATQRPAGVIKDNLRANTNLRVALRMADESDSTDVIGSPVAAGFDPAVPGRGIAKTGPGRLAGFQTGYAGGWTTKGVATPSIDIADLTMGAERVWEAPVPEVEAVQADLGPNDTARLVATFTAAAAAAKIPAPRKPWLDELASVYDLSLLLQRSDDELVIGVTDDASTQAQYPVYFRPDTDGNIAFYGTGGTGKSTAMRTIATAAAITPRGGPVHVYGIDFGSGGLRLLEPLPHVGAIISGDDTERTIRLLTMLRKLVDERVERYGAVRAGTVAEYRKLANKPDEPRILLLIDGMAIFRTEYEYTGAPAFTMFQQLLTDGRQVGVHAVVSADRPGSISPSVSSAIQRRVVLRLADDMEYGSIDTPNDVLSASSPAGRAVIDQLETQVAVFGGTGSIADQSRAIEALAATMTARGVIPAPPVERLADDIPLESVLGSLPGQLVLGVADDTLQPVGIEPAGVFMVVGPPSSGRSTALTAIVASLSALDPKGARYYIGNQRSAVRGLAGWTKAVAGPEAASELAKELLDAVNKPATDKTRVTVVIESLSEFLSTPADPDLVALVKAAKRNDHFVVGESETSTWTQSWPLLLEFKSARRGFALQPDPMEGDLLFKTSFPRFKRAEFPVGRGMLVAAGKTRRVQLARP